MAQMPIGATSLLLFGNTAFLLFLLQISHELFNLSNFCHIQLPAVVKVLYMGLNFVFWGEIQCKIADEMENMAENTP